MKFTKIIKTAVASILVASTVAASGFYTTAADSYTDVSEGSWYYDEVMYTKDNNLMVGFDDGSFKPLENMTRAQLVTVLYRLAGEPKVKTYNPFKDVTESNWFYDEVMWAYANSIVTGVTKNEFVPGANITREQLAVIFKRYSDSIQNGGSVTPADITSYPDYTDVSAYAKEGLAWAVGAGLVNGIKDGDVTTLSPKSSATRAQVATIIKRFVTELPESDIVSGHHPMTIEQVYADICSYRKKRVFIDSDTYNEMDDQYAIAYALGHTDDYEVLGIGAAGFGNNQKLFKFGTTLSYNEINNVLDKCHLTEKYPVFMGAETTVTWNGGKAVDNPASREIIRLAHESDEILYVMTLGCATNITSAILLDPTIKDKICVIALFTHTESYGNLSEFNYQMDKTAAKTLLNSGVNMVLMPACGLDHEGLGTMWIRMYRSDIDKLNNGSDACEYLGYTLPHRFRAYNEDAQSWGHIMWDIAAPGFLVHPEKYEVSIIPAPVITNSDKISFANQNRHKIIYMYRINDPHTLIDETMECILGF